MNLVQKIEDAITAILEFEGYSLVRVSIEGLEKKNVQVMIERLDQTAINVDECAKISRIISLHLSVEKILSGSYILEVSSPGIDRPLIKIADFRRFIGSEVLVKTKYAIKERKKFQGKLIEATEDFVKLYLSEPLESKENEVIINYSDIRSANLYVKW